MSEHLEQYSQNFKIDVDELWNFTDVDGNGMLDREECRVFLREIRKHAVRERARNYDEGRFDELFDKFDEDLEVF